MPNFLQIHWLASYPATLLNRDDSGFAKRLPFGDAIRTRVSSQSLKRHWRKAQDEWSLANCGAPMSVRSRQVPELRIRPMLDAANAGDEAIRNAVTAALAENLYGGKGSEVKNRQALLLGDPEIDYLGKKAIEIAQTAENEKAASEMMKQLFSKQEKANLSALREQSKLAAGLEAALFGRMITSDAEANTEAAIHVGHAFTVHEEASESDYFTVVDDLKQEAGEAGTAGLFDTELTAGLFYGYVVVDVEGLVRNLGDDRELAGRVVEHLVHLIATVSPGAKKGSTAPYAYAQMMLIEWGKRQPRTLANAFRTPTKARGTAAEAALKLQLEQIDNIYGCKEERRHLALSAIDLPHSQSCNLDALAAYASACVAKVD